MEQPEQNIEALNDLPVADDAQIKGGPIALENVQITSYQHGVMDSNSQGTHVAGTFGAMGNNNHNETTAADEDNETLADLPVEEAEQIKGGPGGGWGCQTCDYSNHNETLAEDEEVGEAGFAGADLDLSVDLPVTDEQAQQVKGGTDQFSVNYAKIKF